MYALSPPPLPHLHGLLTKVYSSCCACGSSRSDKWVSLSDMMSKYLKSSTIWHKLSLLTVRPLIFWWMIFSHFLDDNSLSSGWLSGVFDLFGLGWTSISLFRRIRNNESEAFVKRRHPRTVWLEIGIGSQQTSVLDDWSIEFSLSLIHKKWKIKSLPDVFRSDVALDKNIPEKHVEIEGKAPETWPSAMMSLGLPSIWTDYPSPVWKRQLSNHVTLKHLQFSCPSRLRKQRDS